MASLLLLAILIVIPGCHMCKLFYFSMLIILSMGCPKLVTSDSTYIEKNYPKFVYSGLDFG